MAVIIPMAKMPNNCEECDLKALCPDYWAKIREEYTRPSWCQLDDLDATTFCGVPMEEAVEIMQMYRRGELVHFKNYAIKTEPQTSGVVWTEDAIKNEPKSYSTCASTDEPQTQLTAKCLECNNSKTCKENHWEGCRYEPLGYEVTAVVGTIKDEPQTEPLQTCSVNGRPYSECSSCEHFKCTADEPQTDCPWK